MSVSRVAVLAAFLLVLCLPFLVRPAGTAPARPATGKDAQTLIIVTPHIEQIRTEFEQAFIRWYARRFPGEAPVTIDWRIPGGTSDIVKQLAAEYEAAVKNAARDGRLKIEKRSDDGKSAEVTLDERSMSCDLMFGGGSYEHGQLKRGVTLRVTVDGQDLAATVRISEPAGFPSNTLLSPAGAGIGSGEGGWFENNKIGNQLLFDTEQYWIGTALSGFGIVFNRLVLADLGLPEPRSFQDLTDPRYAGMVALSDPRQSGSVLTTYESILNKEGWAEGWRILRDMSANARYFAGTSTKPPIDVSLGEAAAGLAIDFYGRGQGQAILDAAPKGDPVATRVGYVDPKGAVYIDADPISIMRGCPHPELARRFLEFCLSDEAQALWQFPAVSSPGGASNPAGPDGRPMGPARYELRRMPVRQAMYRKYMDHFVDRVNPFELAAALPDRRWRSSVSQMMTAFGIDTYEDLRAAWAALNRARADRAFSPGTLAEMERLFYAFPTGDDVQRVFGARFPGRELPAAARLDFSDAVTDAGDKTENPKGEDNCRRIVATWADAGLKARLKIVYTEFFRENYRKVVGMSEGRDGR